MRPNDDNDLSTRPERLLLPRLGEEDKGEEEWADVEGRAPVVPPPPLFELDILVLLLDLERPLLFVFLSEGNVPLGTEVDGRAEEEEDDDEALRRSLDALLEEEPPCPLPAM